MNNQQSQSPCIVLSQHRGDGERELKFEVKTEECVREIRPLGFVIEFRLESAVLDVSAVSSDMERYGPSLRCVSTSREKKKKRKKKEKEKLDTAPTHRQRRPSHVTALDAGAAPLAPRPCFPTRHSQLHKSVSCEIRFFSIIIHKRVLK